MTRLLLAATALLLPFSVFLPSANAAAPTIVSVTPAPGSVLSSLTQITVQFSEPITGLSADELNIHGIGATNLTGASTTYTFTFAPPLHGEVPITWLSGHGITDLAVPPNAFDETQPGATWSYTVVDSVPPTVATLFPEAGATVRTLGQIQIHFSEDVGGVDAADLLINSQTATNLIAQPNAVYLFQFAQPPNGLASVTFAPGHGIADFATPSNIFAGGSWNYTVNPADGMAGVIINEFNAANENGLKDEEGEAQDWIELFNAGTNTVNLAGWSLSDNKDESGQWVFPSRVLSPGQHLVVFASAKDRKSPVGANRFHTNFRLGSDPEFLGLFTPDSPRQLASGFSPRYPQQRNDHSYGRDPAGQLRYFATPTPGASNGASTIIGVAEPVHFSTARGHFTQPFSLTLSCPTRGAVIRFTTNGAEPTLLNSFVYSLPLAINGTRLLRAAAFRPDLLPSPATSHSFFFNQSAAIRSLPIISIQTASNNMTGPTGIIGINGGNYNAGTWAPNPGATNDYHNTTKKGIAWERPMSVEFIRPADNSGFQIDSGMRVQGSDYTRPRYTPTSKFSYRLYFRGDYGAARLEYPIFGDSVVRNFDQIVLRAGHNDETNPFLRDELVRQLSADMGQVASHGGFVNFFINGVYKGYYNPCERIEEGFLQSWHGGGSSWDIITVGSAVQGGDAVAWNNMRSYVSGQNVLLPSVYTEITRRLDLVNFIDYLIVNTYGANWDWPHNNWRAARERAPGGLFRFYIWDAEGAFGLTGRGTAFDSFTTTDSPLLNGSGEIATLYTRLRNSPEFRLLWADRVQKHFFNNGAMTDTNIANRFIEMRAELLGVIPGINSSILTSWIPQRRAPLMTQYGNYGLRTTTNAPFFNQHGGTVAPGFALTMSITNGSGTIYYTTNGDDPRVMFTGAVSNSAVAYSGPLTLNQSTLIKARTLNGTNWSALTEASFAVATLGVPLRITEVHYNPADSTAYEFIELQNIGTAPVDLSGMSFEGITYTFPSPSTLAAGARLVLASNFDTNIFRLRYPGATVRGYYSGSLNNGGERIVLKDAAGNVITSLDYDDAAGWAIAADGGGASLEIIDPYGDPDDPANWRASTAAGGTPGNASAPPALGSVRLNEVLADNVTAVNHAGTFPDFVELANTSGTPVSLAGWSLADDGDARKFVFPSGTTIEAGGYLTVWCDTNATPGWHSGFSFGRNGDHVFLYDANTNLADALTLGLQLPNYSVGRIGDAWVLNTPTTNAANVAAAVGTTSSLSINEFLANALPGNPDWIELFNNSALPVPLRGVFLSITTAVHQITSPSFIAPFGFVQLFADEGVGPDHLDFKLSAAGGTIVLYDNVAAERNRVTYAAQSEGISRGRLPDGAASFVNFPGTASPGATNYTASYAGPVLNEVLARNVSAVTNAAGRVTDYVELYNPGASAFSLAGFRLSVNSSESGQWVFPPDATVAGQGYVVIWCDGGQPASTNAGNYNTGSALDGESGGAYLFNAAGQLVNSIEYGFQIADRSIGMLPIASAWRLLSTATPGAANSAFAALGPNTGLRLNEWMAQAADGPDWFEIFNSTNLPVDMTGLVLTDDPTTSGTNEFRVPPLSFIGAVGFVQWIADSQPDQGRNHVNFDLDTQGETIRLYATNGSTIIDSIAFGAQNLGVSEGRIPDGAGNAVIFPGSPTPAESNYRAINDVVINEIITYVASALGQWIELRNTTPAEANIGGWFLSDSASSPKKFRISDGSVIPANGFALFQESQFRAGPNAFSFDRARGGELWLSAADAAGNLTGFRTRVKFGAAAEDVSFGRYEASGETEFVAQSARSFGANNAGPLVGPIVISEIMYHPLDNVVGATEFIELRNITDAAVDLFDPVRPANRWRLGDAIEFTLPQGTTIGPNGHVLVVDFDPVTNPVALALFRAHYGISTSVPVFGPFLGSLNNGGETIDLFKPELPDGSFVPYVRVDKVSYRDSAPWPSGAVDGGGLSLQRRNAGAYGNDAANWLAAAATAGSANATAPTAPPVIVQSPRGTNALVNTDVFLQAAATGIGPFAWQWRFNGADLPGATNALLALNYVRLNDAGTYDVYVSNPGGPVFSTAAQVSVVEPAVILSAPPSRLAVRGGLNTTFNVLASGTDPLHYQWQFEGTDIPGATAPTLAFTNLILPQSGTYSMIVSNAYGTSVSNVTLTVLVNPGITNQPTPRTVVQHQTARFTVVAGPNHPLLPLSYRWLRQGVNFLSNAPATLVITNVQPAQAGSFRVTITNLAGSVNSTTVVLTVLPDGDADGLPDAWETNYFGNASNALADVDSDGDGIINVDEFIAGTNPTNALSLLKLSLTATNAGLLEFVAQTNVSYTVQWRTNLASAFWNNLTSINAQSLVSTVKVNTATAPAADERYFRVVTPQVP